MPENPRKSRECPRKFLENPMNLRISMQKTSEQSHFYLPKNAGRPAGKASIIVETDDAGGGGGAPMGKLTAVWIPRGHRDRQRISWGVTTVNLWLING